MRGQVEKYLPAFKNYVAKVGEEPVFRALKTGKGITVCLNRKDRMQMLDALFGEKPEPGRDTI